MVDRLKKKLSGFKDNISNLSNSSLFATIIGSDIELKAIWKKIKYDWHFLEGGFQLIPMDNNWFEMKFDLTEDRNKVWEGRPFHINHQLLLLKPWRLDFDPITEPLTVVDVWVRFPGLPIQFVSNDVLASIAEENGLGKVFRVDAFNIKGARHCYPRVCVAVDITKIPAKEVTVIDEFDKPIKFSIWFEDFSEGCGSCGAADHIFKECPLRIALHNVGDPISMEAGVADAPGRVDDEEKGEWVRALSKKKRELPPLRIGHPKTDLIKSIGINASPVTESSSSKLSDKSSDEESRVDAPPSAPLVSVQPATPASCEAPLEDVCHSLMPILFDDEIMGLMAVEPPLPMVSPYTDDDEDILDYGDEIYEEGFENMVEMFNQEDIEGFFQQFPPSVEFMLPDLPNNSPLTDLMTIPTDAPSLSPSMVQRFEQLGVEASSTSESAKRKSGTGVSDTASSILKIVAGHKSGKFVS